MGGGLRPVGLALAGLGLAAMAWAAYLFLVPPGSECAGGTPFECRREAYEDRAGMVLVATIAALAFMGAAVGCLGVLAIERRRGRRQPRPTPQPVAALPPVRGTSGPLQQVRGHGVVPTDVRFARSGPAAPEEGSRNGDAKKAPAPRRAT